MANSNGRLPKRVPALWQDLGSPGGARSGKRRERQQQSMTPSLGQSRLPATAKSSLTRKIAARTPNEKAQSETPTPEDLVAGPGISTRNPATVAESARPGPQARLSTLRRLGFTASESSYTQFTKIFARKGANLLQNACIFSIIGNICSNFTHMYLQVLEDSFFLTFPPQSCVYCCVFIRV